MLEFLRIMWLGITEAMRLNPEAFAVVMANQQPRGLILAIAVTGGASLLLGQSVILFVNRVRPARFIFSLLLNGVIFALSLAIWAVAIWATGRLLFPNDIPLLTVLQLVGLGAAPYVFGFLVLLPYAGTFIGKVLSVWSFLVVLAGLTTLAQGRLGAALICTTVGWLLIMVMSATIGRPIIYLRNRVWKLLTGADMDASVQDILTQLAADDSPARKGNEV